MFTQNRSNCQGSDTNEQELKQHLLTETEIEQVCFHVILIPGLL